MHLYTYFSLAPILMQFVQAAQGLLHGRIVQIESMTAAQMCLMCRLFGQILPCSNSCAACRSCIGLAALCAKWLQMALPAEHEQVHRNSIAA